jgi:hypothetical protein
VTDGGASAPPFLSIRKNCRDMKRRWNHHQARPSGATVHAELAGLLCFVSGSSACGLPACERIGQVLGDHGRDPTKAGRDIVQRFGEVVALPPPPVLTSENGSRENSQTESDAETRHQCCQRIRGNNLRTSKQVSACVLRAVLVARPMGEARGGSIIRLVGLGISRRRVILETILADAPSSDLIRATHHQELLV